jgi:thioredoxin 1
MLPRYKMNIEEAEDVANEYGVSAVPTFMLFKDGDMLPEDKISGPHHLKVREMIEKNIKK